MEARDLGNKNGDDEGDEHGEREPGVATLLADGVSGEDGEALVADGEDVAPLEHDEGDEVDALADVVEVFKLVGGVAVEAVRVGLEGEDEGVEGDACFLVHVQEEHGVSDDGLHDADEEVRLGVDLEVDEVVLFVVAGREAEEVEFFFLHDEREGEEEVGEDADDDHEEGAEGEWDAEEDVHQHRPDLGPAACGEQVGDDLLQVLEDQAAEADRVDDGVEFVEQDQVGCLDGDVAAGDDGDADVRGAQCGSVVDAVAGHRDDVVARLELLDDAVFLFGRGAGEDDLFVLADGVPLLTVEGGYVWAVDEETASRAEGLLLVFVVAGEWPQVVDSVWLRRTAEDAHVPGNGGRCQAKVAGHHEEADACTAAGRDGPRGLGTGQVDDAKDANHRQVVDTPGQDLIIEVV